MRRLLWVGALLAGKAFSLDVDSLPVWSPDLLRHTNEKPPVDTFQTTSKLETHGLKTMQVTVGDGDTQVDQTLRLSITGLLGDSIAVDALLSDVDRKAGDQTTATLQEVDQVYFRVESRHWMLHLGDITWKDFDLGLVSIERTTLGGMLGFRTNYSEVRAVVGTGETRRNVRTFNGVSGQREGYALDESRNFISIVPESETVWMNGVRLTRGVDYEVNYAGGLLNFKGSYMPGTEDEIRVEYDAYDEDSIESLYAATGKYRHPNVYLDVSAFRLENDVDRLKKGVWTDEDYAQLKEDDGKEFVRDDTLGALNRPARTEKASARMRLQAEHRYYADVEVAYSRKDSNTVSDEIEGPEGRAFRWLLTTDSTASMSRFPVAFSVYGNYFAEGFDLSGFRGSDDDWNSYKLKDEWDLDSALLAGGNFRHDEFDMRLRLGGAWIGSLAWGYRQGDSERWNSSRVKGTLRRDRQGHLSEIGLVHVQSQAGAARERFQGYFSEKYARGFIQPFAASDVRYTERDSAGLTDGELSIRSSVGTLLDGNLWNLRESLEFWDVSLGGDSHPGAGGKSTLDSRDEWADSLRQITWNQSAEVRLKGISLTHFLQYEYRDLAESGDEHNWAGDLNARFGNDRRGISGNIGYKLGLTEEQTYTAIYKAVAKGTGDVRYDSLTGTFIEGVDNGDFVYEGMGRNDSIGAVRSSNANFEAALEWIPSRMFGIGHGILRDVKLGGTFSAVSADTTGEKVYFPGVLPSALKKVSSGTIAWSGNVEWNHPAGVMLAYRPSADFDKKLSSVEYYESTFRHTLEGGYKVNEKNFVGAEAFTENVELTALEDLEWNIRSVSAKYRYGLLDGLNVEPGGRFRYGEGNEVYGGEFDAYLWEAYLKLGYRRSKRFDGFVRFGTVRMETEDAVPYQMMSGYSEGYTFRLETSASLTVNKNITFGLYYVLRFGNAEENVFQKLSTEARALF